MYIVLLAGKAGTGKSYVADGLISRLEGVYRGTPSTVYKGSFAASLKKIAVDMGWDEKKDTKGRTILQEIGAVGRNYDINTWVDKIINRRKHDDDDILVVDDWRFPNENVRLVSLGHIVVTVGIYAPGHETLKGTPQEHDASETSLPAPDVHLEDVYDLIVLNDRCDDEEFNAKMALLTMLICGLFGERQEA